MILPARLEFSGSAYRGLGLGGLGAGGYKDFVYRIDPDTNGYYVRPLDDVGGWAQLKEKLTERVELNAAFGMDNVVAGQLRRYAVPGGTVYQNLARNRTYTGNVIYSPNRLSALLFRISSSGQLSCPRVICRGKHPRVGRRIQVLMNTRRLALWLFCGLTLFPLPLRGQQSAMGRKSELHLRIVSTQQDKHRTVPAVAWLEPVAGTSPLPFTPQGHYSLLQKNRTFIPHLQVIPVGSVVQFPNAIPSSTTSSPSSKASALILGFMRLDPARRLRFRAKASLTSSAISIRR